MPASLGKLLIGSCIGKGVVGEWLALGKIEHLFKPTEAPLFDFVHAHVTKFGQLPQPETVEAHTGEEVAHAPEPPGYYHELLITRFIEQELKTGMKAASEKLGVTDKDPAAALRILADAVMGVMARQNTKQISDFRDAYEEVIGDYVSKFHLDEGAGLRFGWPTVDEMTGGLVRGDMASMVGRPAMGKTMALLKACHHSWKKQKLPQLFVSMEMAALPIKQRLAALEAKVPGQKLKNAELSTEYWIKLKGALTGIKTHDVPLWVVEGNLTATVEDIWVLARQLAVGGIWIDGGYLLKHPKERDRFKRVAENAELIKQDLTPLAPTVVSWQFARPPKGTKKTQHQYTMDDIGYTDAIAQVSSLAIGVLKPDQVDNLNARDLEILKGRNGETGSFRINWNWVDMDFDELVETPVTELEFV